MMCVNYPEIDFTVWANHKPMQGSAS